MAWLRAKCYATRYENPNNVMFFGVLLRYVFCKLLILKECYMLRFFGQLYAGENENVQVSKCSLHHTLRPLGRRSIFKNTLHYNITTTISI